MTRDQLVAVLRREVPRKYVPASKPMPVGATEWWLVRYIVLETDEQRIQRLADVILALDESC